MEGWLLVSPFRRGYSAVCVYSVSDISERFRTSPLKNYSGKTPAVKPGQVKSSDEDWVEK